MANSKSIQVFDVSKPGKSTPNATSRPVIVGHGPMLKDPMVNEEDDKDEDKDEKQSVPKLPEGSVGEKVVNPPEEEKKPKEPEDDESKQTGDTPEEKEAEPTDNTSSEESSQPESSEEPKDDGSVKDSLDDKQEDGTKSKEDKKQLAEDQEDEARQKEIEKLIEQKKYFIPTGQVAKKRHITVVSVIAVLILLAAVAYLVVDAGIIALNIKLPLDIIK